MKKVRVIAKLDVKGPNVVKGIQLEGLRVVGKPDEFAKKYYEQGADEILYIDIVASLYERNNLKDIVEKATSSGIYIPITVGGGIRKIEDVKLLLRSGADKVAINTAATRNPEFITEAAKMFGSQCIVGSVEAKYRGDGKWEAYIDNGRERTGLDAIEWAQKLVELGAGELLITSVDRDGTKYGFDTELVKKITELVPVPVIACGGASSEQDVCKCLKETKCDGAAFGTILHYDETTIGNVKKELKDNGIKIREINKVEQIESKESKKTVSVLDYGAGNLKSVINAFKSIGNEVKLITKPEEVLEAELLVLPGDGAFGYAMSELNKRGLVKPLKEYVESSKPLFGICLGMQLLMSSSKEFGAHEGLNIIEGDVIEFKDQEEVKDDHYRVPHMGWNNLIKPEGANWQDTVLSETPENALAYFVHSFCVIPKDKSVSLANTIYGDQEFCTVIKKGNVFGTQFHPEKSGEIGINMLKYFCNMG